MQVDGGINAYTGHEVPLHLGTAERDSVELCRGVHHDRLRYSHTPYFPAQRSVRRAGLYYQA
jgi:hypothetical protein